MQEIKSVFERQWKNPHTKLHFCLQLGIPEFHIKTHIQREMDVATLLVCIFNIVESAS